MFWQTSRFRLELSEPRVMGIVNVTPDSFSDGGVFFDTAVAMKHCESLLHDGADILDIGAESSRPGAAAVSWSDEWQRVFPVLQGALSLGCPVSIDTTKAELMERALAMGVDIINDINALRDPDGLAAVAAHDQCGVCLMHMQGQPQGMQAAPKYVDVVREVTEFLALRARELTIRGVLFERIVLDPGIGFGKTVAHNLELLRRQGELRVLGFPLLVGWSRKSTLGAVTGKSAQERLAASVAAALAAVQHGARIVRVHDVAATVDALKVWKAAGLLT
ncbi:MAG: dihydropteroate synthase [Pseudorhodobacter sp.]|nr:dihydropteroate synthase [Rhizobacter sp.]